MEANAENPELAQFQKGKSFPKSCKIQLGTCLASLSKVGVAHMGDTVLNSTCLYVLELRRLVQVNLNVEEGIELRRIVMWAETSLAPQGKG